MHLFIYLFVASSTLLMLHEEAKEKKLIDFVHVVEVYVQLNIQNGCMKITAI